MKNIWLYIIALVCCLALATACSVEGDGGDEDEDEDTSDSSAEDFRPECPINSGWPCTCEMTSQGVECQDGASYCLSLLGTAYGFGWCAATSSSQGGTCASTDYSGTGSGVIDGVDFGVTALCVLQCEAHTDCPPDQMCRPIQDNVPMICMP